ncbi:Protein Brevis radix-like 3 [Prunus dulcis]|uniref:Protein Brevis radix-like 3 n=1 Tax=Prunus dulcis TaxID=3755 RepID=A0A4Y1R3D6_PRUDU|nr:Protein Brevis radix-like 3 [Prunus dulcis]
MSAISLQRKCQIGSHKIHECQQKMEETWSLAREEAATCKAAHEIIKALALRSVPKMFSILQFCDHDYVRKVSAGRETNDVVAKIVPQLTPLNTDTSNRHLLPQVDSIPDTPIGFSDTPKSLYKRDTCLKKGRPEEDLHPAKTESQQRETKAVKLEWVEQYEPGVYITLVVLPSGQKGLKRVRFSRKKFADKDAERWWEANQGLVYQKYDIEEGYENSKEI